MEEWQKSSLDVGIEASLFDVSTSAVFGHYSSKVRSKAMQLNSLDSKKTRKRSKVQQVSQSSQSQTNLHVPRSLVERVKTASFRIGMQTMCNKSTKESQIEHSICSSRDSKTEFECIHDSSINHTRPKEKPPYLFISSRLERIKDKTASLEVQQSQQPCLIMMQFGEKAVPRADLLTEEMKRDLQEIRSIARELNLKSAQKLPKYLLDSTTTTCEEKKTFESDVTCHKFDLENVKRKEIISQLLQESHKLRNEVNEKLKRLEVWKKKMEEEHEKKWGTI